MVTTKAICLEQIVRIWDDGSQTHFNSIGTKCEVKCRWKRPCGGYHYVQMHSGEFDLHDHHCRNPTLRQVWGWNSHSQKWELGSPLRLPKTQSLIVGVKTPCIEVFFIPLESFWSVDVENGLTLAIWISATQVMVERKAGSQTGSLTPDH